MNLEVRTRSVPTAAHLNMMGHALLGVGSYPDGSKYFRFDASAREELEAFLVGKQRMDERLQAGE